MFLIQRAHGQLRSVLGQLLTVLFLPLKMQARAGTKKKKKKDTVQSVQRQ